MIQLLQLTLNFFDLCINNFQATRTYCRLDLFIKQLLVFKQRNYLFLQFVVMTALICSELIRYLINHFLYFLLFVYHVVQFGRQLLNCISRNLKVCILFTYSSFWKQTLTKTHRALLTFLLLYRLNF